MKANLDYIVRSITPPGETEPTLVPVIVNRLPSRSLEVVIANAIKNNLIAGLQGSAVSGIAAGIADQIYDTLCEGRGVRFGSYFYVRPNLTGLTDANGTLSRTANGIDATIIAGPDFALTLADYSMHFSGKDARPKIDLIKYHGDGSDNGVVMKGVPTQVHGSLLVVSESDGAKVTFANAESSVDVTTFSTKGAQLLEFDTPEELVAGKTYNVHVTRSDESGRIRVSNVKAVAVKAGATPPVPAPTITEATSEGSDPGHVNVDGHAVYVKGTNLENGGTVKVYDTVSEEPLVEAEGTWNSDQNALEAFLETENFPQSPDGRLTVTTEGGTASIEVDFGS